MTFDVEEISPRRKSADEAIKFALESRWEEAVEANQAFIEQFPNDTEGLNRLGKALMELGRYDEAREAYQKSYELDHVANVIARKQLQRLEGLSQGKRPRPEGSPKIAAQLFIEETGKTGIAQLLNIDDKVLKLLAAGDSVELTVDGKTLWVTDSTGKRIGEVDPKLGLRLLPLIETGNTYAAAMHSIDEGARVIIRETFQSEANVGKVSFPPSSADAVRPYIRDTLVRTDDEEEELVDETGEEWVDTEAVEAEEEEAESPLEAARIADAVGDDDEFEE
jgi:hypothetical protein